MAGKAKKSSAKAGKPAAKKSAAAKPAAKAKAAPEISSDLRKVALAHALRRLK
jgi:hypothetical protein